MPLVKDVVEQLGIEKNVQLRVKRNVASQLDSLKSDLQKSIKQSLNDTNKSVQDTLIELRELIENNQLDLTDEQFERLSLAVETQTDKITDISQHYVQQSEAVERLIEKTETVAAAFESIVATTKQQIDKDIKKSRSDTATAIKNTREKIADVEATLDAFIDTISEKIAELN